MILAALPLSPANCRVGSPERRAQTLHRQRGTLFVPGLRHQFEENLEGTYSAISQDFSKTALALAGPGCPGLTQGQQDEVSKA